MKVFLTGATGFLGRALGARLSREGHAVVAWVRSAARARAVLGEGVELVEVAAGEAGLRAALARCEAVVNLAGEPVLARWTEGRRARLRSSRVDLTRRLVGALAGIDPRPRILVSGSAVGFYGDRGAERLTEASPAGAGFLPELCIAWEDAAQRAEGAGLRVVCLRTGIVLGRQGGALAQMLPPFRLGLGGRLGTGAQFMPWIHLEDWVRAASFALVDERVRGALNVTAPDPPSNRELTRVLASVLGRPAFLPVPGLALQLLFGDAASILLESQRAEPARLTALSFAHSFPTLEPALRDLLAKPRAPVPA